MNATALVRQAPRLIIRTYARAARVPIDLAAHALRRPSDGTWPPVLVLERVEGAVETAVGSVLGDQALVEEGRQRQEWVAERRAAAVAEAEERARAEQREQEAQRQAELHAAKLEEKARRKLKKQRGNGEETPLREVAAAALAATTEDEVEAAVAPLD